METNRVGLVTGTHNTWKRVASLKGTQKHGNAARPAKAGTPAKKHSHFIGPFIRPDQVLISYKINDENGAIKAHIINAESGKVIREIDVKPPVRLMYGKGSLFKSVA